MTTVETTELRHPYAYPLISWGSVILGAVVSVALVVLLGFLAVVFDATAAANQANATPDGGGAAALGGAIWTAVANFLALFAGGFIAARAANHADHHDGMLHGLAVWSVVTIAALVLFGAAASRLLGVAATGMAAAPPAATAQVDPQATAPGAQPQMTTPAAPAAQDEAAARAGARQVATATATTAFLLFGGALVGLIASLIGGVFGARHPHHWQVRHRHQPHAVRTAGL